MVDEVSDRIDEWLPSDLTDKAEIEAAIGGTAWTDEMGPATVDAVTDRVSGERSPDTSAVSSRTRKQTSVFGPEDERRTVVRAEDGTVVGDRENVETWEDRWGNVMAHNTKTGTRKKIDDGGN